MRTLTRYPATRVHPHAQAIARGSRIYNPDSVGIVDTETEPLTVGKGATPDPDLLAEHVNILDELDRVTAGRKVRRVAPGVYVVWG